MVLISDYDVSLWTLVYIIIGIFMLIFVLEHFRKIALNQENSDSLKSTNKSSASVSSGECTSPGCVRCNKSKSILENAQQRLHLYSQSTENDSNDGQLTALEKDIDHSLNCLMEQNTGITELSLVSKSKSSPNVLFIRGLEERSIIPPSVFPELKILVDNYDRIKLEFNHLYKSPLPETKILWKTNATDNGRWEIAQLIDQGTRTTASTLCPITMNILSQLMTIMDTNVFGNASFSVVHPETTIERHCGSTNCRIRCHLGLQIPRVGCSLEVDGVRHRWQEGGVLCFNDAFPHSVTHSGDKSSGPRVILMVDLWHPDLTASQQKLIDIAFRAAET